MKLEKGHVNMYFWAYILLLTNSYCVLREIQALFYLFRLYNSLMTRLKFFTKEDVGIYDFALIACQTFPS